MQITLQIKVTIHTNSNNMQQSAHVATLKVHVVRNFLTDLGTLGRLIHTLLTDSLQLDVIVINYYTTFMRHLCACYLSA